MIAQDIYDITMALMDEMKDNGDVDIQSTKDYLARTPGILTILQTEVTMFLKTKGVNVDTLDRLTSMQDDVDLDDSICMGVLPYALASRLLGQEDSSLSNYFNSLYGEKLETTSETLRTKAKRVDIEDYYDATLSGGDY